VDTFQFNPYDYGEKFADLIDPKLLNDLGPGRAKNDLKDKINLLKLDQAFEPDGIVDNVYANACLSAIWLHHDFLDESHSISQNITNPTGSFWHGIMHRRERDFWNSKYWFRQVDKHPIFPSLHSTVLNTINVSDLTNFKQSHWDPISFIDMVEKYSGTDSEGEENCKIIQRLEWQILFDYSYKNAIGKL